MLDKVYVVIGSVLSVFGEFFLFMAVIFPNFLIKFSILGGLFLIMGESSKWFYYSQRSQCNERVIDEAFKSLTQPLFFTLLYFFTHTEFFLLFALASLVAAVIKGVFSLLRLIGGVRVV
jgi:hypothetical protein